MADYDKEIVTPLLRRRAHLEEVGADAAKKAEIDHALRMAGYPIDDEPALKRGRVEQEKPDVPRAETEQKVADDDSEREQAARKVAPKERSVTPKQVASKDVAGSSAPVSPKPVSKAAE